MGEKLERSEQMGVFVMMQVIVVVILISGALQAVINTGREEKNQKRLNRESSNNLKLRSLVICLIESRKAENPTDGMAKHFKTDLMESKREQ